MVTPAQTWKKEYQEGVEVTLDSGKVVRVRPVGFDTFITYGGIPDQLTPHVEALLKAQSTGKAAEELLGNLEDFQAQNTIINLFCITCIIEPKFSLAEPGTEAEDEVSIHLLSDSEKVQIYTLLGRSTAQIKEFFRKQEKSVESVPVSKVGRRKTK